MKNEKKKSFVSSLKKLIGVKEGTKLSRAADRMF